jgi:hypothetical protein
MLDTLITNLTEADIDEKDISVVTKNANTKTYLTNKGGPLKNATYETLEKVLNKQKIPHEMVEKIVDVIGRDGSLVVVDVDPTYEEAVQKMLQDYPPQSIEVI